MTTEAAQFQTRPEDFKMKKVMTVFNLRCNVEVHLTIENSVCMPCNRNSTKESVELLALLGIINM